MDVIQELKFFGKFMGGGVPGGGGFGLGGHDGCERRIEVFVNIQKKKLGGGGVRGRGGGVGGKGQVGGQGGCERRIEVFVKILWGGSGGGVGGSGWM